ncbi:MAG: hypothetical protein FWF52_04225 [Candidatus Azobacteroides sp.]|nr:hypothetical protein [Candidatus Azobacteroides sp.]
MKGNFYLDGQDAYSLYRVSARDDGYKELAAYPPLKPVESNDWAEEDGEEFDLSHPVLDSHEISVRFAYHGEYARFGAFIEQLSDRAYHYFSFTEMGRKTYRLRLVSQPDLSQIGTLGNFSLRLADDFPLSGYSYLAPQSTLAVLQRGYKLDGRDLSEYGVSVLRGSEAEIAKSPAVKKNLLMNFNSQSGAIYDDEWVAFQTKEVKLNCLMRANSLSEFWRNHDALLFDLIRPGERMLQIDSRGCSYPCYYKSCNAAHFEPDGKIWFEFSLVLAFTSFRVDEEEFLLASEDAILVRTEQEDFAINMSIYYGN